MTGHRYKCKYGVFATLELAAGRLGLSIERAEAIVSAGTGEIVLVAVDT